MSDSIVLQDAIAETHRREKERRIEAYASAFDGFNSEEISALEEPIAYIPRDDDEVRWLARESIVDASTERKRLVKTAGAELASSCRLNSYVSRYPQSGIEPLPASWFSGAIDEHIDSLSSLHVTDWSADA